MLLQLFAEEKTEKATPKKRQDLKKKGYVFQSRDLTAAAIILVSILAFNALFPFIAVTMESFIKDLFTSYVLNHSDLYTVANLQKFFVFILTTAAKIVVPIALLTAATGLLLNYGQVGFIFTGEALGFKLERLNPLEGLRRIFSTKGVVELIKSLVKVALIGFVLYTTVKSQIDMLPQLLDMSIEEINNYLVKAVVEIGLKAGMLILGISVLDYLYQWWDFERGIMMTKQEVKDEIKEMEGNPHVKSRIRERQRKSALRRMMSQVPEADVVITNPTHYAVALKYDIKIAAAPVVVAKGVDFLAQRIKEEAKKNGVPIMENKELARNLYHMVDIGQMIPEELYYAVAEVLAFVYSINREKRVRD
ncbi:flagellar biosynthesis protein FlhB [Caldanaerobius polysaccharolyticus]|uniref:flagellar biosynthesis protein FlhB n=1 Tax=Caldanaerobius polysaccharolyticus TaxID=44256 RepID=UPI000479F38A|nr:flagellar biosynthesis protein FlhB [Caldanaerobius polysaccharolyticus]